MLCSFKLAADGVEFGSSVYDTDRPAFLEMDLVGLCGWQLVGLGSILWW